MKEDRGGVFSGCVKYFGSGEQKNENYLATFRSGFTCSDTASAAKNV